jgi:hypothetical protein
VAQSVGENPTDTPPFHSIENQTPSASNPAENAENAPDKICVTPEDARREIVRLVCVQSLAITQAIINDALQGKYLSAKFLFEAVGLFAADAEDLENPAGRESLASLLLQRWGVVPQEGCITEVSEIAPFVAPVNEAPVEL